MPGVRKPYIYIVVSLWILVHLFLLIAFGVRDNFTDSLRYIGMSDYLMKNDTVEHFHHLFYAVPIVVLSLFRLLFGEGITAFIGFQIALSGLAVLGLYHAASALFKNSFAGFFTAVIFVLWLDCIQWNTALMTESVASSVTCFVIYRLVCFRGSLRDCLTLFFLLVLIVLTRPTGMLVVVSVGIFLLTYYENVLQRTPRLYLSMMVVFALAILSTVLFILSYWDFTDQYLRGNIITYADTVKGTGFYSASLQMDTEELVVPGAGQSILEKNLLFIIHNPAHFLKAAILKVFYLLTFYRPYFSTLHNVYSAVWLSLVYLFLFCGFGQIGNKPVRNFSAALILTNCILVGISAVDWDNRFFIPMQPAMVLLAGGGALYVGSRIFRALRPTSNAGDL